MESWNKLCVATKPLWLTRLITPAGGSCIDPVFIDFAKGLSFSLQEMIHLQNDH